MHDEEALLLTLLDRPHEPAVRLVYADWLEDHGQDELAEWHRLETTAARGRHTRCRLRELRQRHLTDWVDIGGVTVTWHSALAVFRRRLAETVAWCSQQDYKVLRTPELLPQAGRSQSGIEPLWHCEGLEQRTLLVHQLGNRRAARLDELGLVPDVPASDLTGGRLLLFEPEWASGDGTARLYSDSFFDEYQAPPWDTWVFYFDDGDAGRHRVHRHWEDEWILRRKVLPAAFASYLVAWVPPPLVQAVDWACDISGRKSAEWLENVDCDLSIRLRELGWLRAPDRSHTVARREQHVRQSITPNRGPEPHRPQSGAVSWPW